EPSSPAPPAPAPSRPLAGPGEPPPVPLSALGGGPGYAGPGFAGGFAEARGSAEASAETGGSLVARNLPLPPLPTGDPGYAGPGFAGGFAEARGSAEASAGRSPPAVAAAPQVPRPAPRWDPNADNVENLAATIFDDVCYRTKNDPAAIEQRSRTFNWAPIDRQATIRAGFDQGWEMPAPTGETLMVLFDPLGPKCCVSIFPAESGFLEAAVGIHYGLGEPRRQRIGPKEVLVYRPRGTWQITMDFEEIPERGTFASVCYTRR
ncbi:MAG: hypothetical protein ACE5JZ_12790, partial [Kiloniellales bacterium]